MNDIILFKDQQPITDEVIADLTTRGLLVAPKTLHKSTRRETEVTNPTAGAVVGYASLAVKFKENAISQADARYLLIIEATRNDCAPRQTHIDRLMVAAFVEDKQSVLNTIEKLQAQCLSKNQK